VLPPALRRSAATVLVVALSLVVVRPGGTAPAVPEAFRALYAELVSHLDALDRLLARRPSAARVEVTFAAELLPANGNRGPQLLSEQAWPGTLLYLDRLQAMGLGGVTVQMPYPLLDPGFSRSEEYWAFYRRLGQEVRRRGLKLLVKNGPVFTDPEVSPLAPDYSRLGWDEYFAARTRLARRAAAEIAPDYLSIGNEPSTEMKVLGKTGFTEQRYVRYVDDTLRGLRRGNTLVGAGAGNWDRPSFIARLSRETSLDYVDLHVYPLAGPAADYMARASAMADVARRSGKRVIVGETWLYKARASELAGAPIHVEAFGRDTFSFWAPLDQRLLRLMARFARTHGIEYLSAFWSKYFFAYLEHDAHGGLAPGELLREADREAARAIVAGRLSPTGTAYAEIARP
jgi:hypothetical protein